MEMFLDAVLQEFLEAAKLLKRRASGDYSPDQHLQALPEYRKATAPVAPRSAQQKLKRWLCSEPTEQARPRGLRQ
jgi:hypothetical protein